MDLEQNIGREAGSGRYLASEYNAKDILVGESFEQTSVAACWIKETDVKELKTETNEIYRARNEAAASGKLVLDGERGRKERKSKNKDQIYGQLGYVASHGGQRPRGYGTSVRVR